MGNRGVKAVSIPEGSIKREFSRAKTIDEYGFQSQKVRLKASIVYLEQTLQSLFQSQKVRLKVSLPDGRAPCRIRFNPRRFD